MNKIRSYLNSKPWRNLLGSSASKISVLSPVFATFEFLMPLLLGISVGWLGTIFIDYTLSPKRAALQLNMAVNIAAAQNRVDTGNGLTDFLSANPFSISPYPAEVDSTPVITQVEPVKTQVNSSFASATLTWTFPNIGAWIQDNTNNKVEYIPIGDSFDDIYMLTEVKYDRAIFKDNEDNSITKYLNLAKSDAAVVQTAYVPPPQQIVHSAHSNIMAAVPGSQEGVITREDVNNLLMNPFDEMKRFRIRPKFEGNEPVGIEVQWIQNDSILGKLGVARNDVLKSVNGIPMRNMGDITNAINSLMNGSRFDVEVMRGNAPVMLTYVVR